MGRLQGAEGLLRATHACVRIMLLYRHLRVVESRPLLDLELRIDSLSHRWKIAQVSNVWADHVACLQDLLGQLLQPVRTVDVETRVIDLLELVHDRAFTVEFYELLELTLIKANGICVPSNGLASPFEVRPVCVLNKVS